MELCLLLCNILDGRGAQGRMDTCRCMAESLCCPPESVTILLTGYTVIKNQNLLEKEWVVGKGEKNRHFLQSTEQAEVGRKETEECEGNYGTFLFFFFKVFWSIAALQCCVNFCRTSKSLSFMYVQIYTHSFSCSFPLQCIMGYWIQFPVLYSRTLLLNHPLYICLNLMIPNSQSSPPPLIMTTACFGPSYSCTPTSAAAVRATWFSPQEGKNGKAVCSGCWGGWQVRA